MALGRSVVVLLVLVRVEYEVEGTYGNHECGRREESGRC